MKDPYAPHQPEPPKGAVWLAALALGLLVVTNIGWVLAYSLLSQKVYELQKTQTAATTPTATPSPTPPVGTISGRVGYPADSAPAQTVCAVSVSDSSKKYCVDHAAGNALNYTLQAPAGTYYVYASLQAAQGDFSTSYKAYYDKYVTCSTSPNGCAPGLHTQYEQVVVTVGNVTRGVDPVDWYALGVGQ